MLIVTTEQIVNKEIKEVYGYVKGSTIRAKHIGNDIMASLKGIVGGEIKEYGAMLDEARQVAVSRMVKDAEEKGANAIVAFRLQTSTVMSGASEIVAYGTAVRI
ncbi:heavy metal-binding domain-containing protein [Bacillus sp. FJAT-45350]|uniref:heavy metal-binding domain-containing protein n=1 Tax=Bacillus sp. FJAT-45350 TaxID=2011014 RepID=UPI000BB97347|nr:heavy metal-binding domain-containing protein [Bacillus sp. FJAT-45350]